ncbi:uncharacterized protein N7446_010563 [Penicillium canescens]|uniref:Azaphilone pigments biosynthesis cluster protein L N-terminal domain-containing protein n=1 Tax=Penicillium canescens TaxID=5083 RepID=A0AAD6IBQ9_PENCN|nr:uncharacterized protein N7446_010563 [Penicillium canescens]KAJ6041555.1 hypothetical protein N7460_006945 [Penicillium canescens]KAJ6050454.1 hypothetical protein N7446_010563 [Penicillium canescens]KAJ6064757.1 hypothetical protein N7444_000410 [Penicillium canescens]
MAEVIGISSGLAGLLALALESSRTLFSTVQSLRNREKAIRGLREALRDLEEVLKILQDSISTSPFLSSGIIERPLDRCCKACTDFNKLIMQCSEHSTDNHFSIRDWAKLRYMGEDVTGFQNMLSGYKSTITIAFAYSNVHLTRTTQSVMHEYKELIENTKCDLELHLQSIEDRVKLLSSARQADVGLDSIDVQRMKEELESTQHGLEICAQFSSYIEETRSISLQKMTQASGTSERRSSSPEYNMPWLILAEALSSAEREIVSSRLRLLQYRRAQESHPWSSQHRGLLPGNEHTAERSDIKEEAENIKHSLNFFDRVSEETTEGRMNYFEDVSTGDKSKQFIVTTLKDLISARRITSGSGSLQVLGQLSEDSLNNVLRNQEDFRE